MKAFSGYTDAASLVSLVAGTALVLPWAMPVPVYIAGGLAFLGSAGLTWPRIKAKSEFINEDAREGFILESDEPQPESMGSQGLRLGLTKDGNKAVDWENGLMKRHTAIIGQSGVGKTTLIEYLIWQQTLRGGGWLFIDAKIDRDTRDNLGYMAKAAGRDDELYILDISDPDNSHTMNPILHGDPDEVASRLMNLIPASESNPGADFYRQSSNHALTVIVAALQRADKLYHFGDLSILLQSPRALEALEQEVRAIAPDSPELRSLSVFLDQFRKPSKEGVQIDVNRLKQVLGGMSGRIALFAQGKFGKVFNIYAPEIVLESIILDSKMLYVSLPTMGKDTAALNLGKMVISDLRSAVANIQDMPKSKRPAIPFMAVLDEMGAYVMEGVGRLFEQARSAGIALIPAFQSFSQLNKVSPDFADIVIQNTWNKVLFKFGTSEGAEQAADLLGQEMKRQKTVNLTGNETAGAQALRTRPDSSQSAGGGVGMSWKENQDYRVAPDKLMSIGMGEVFCVSGARVYHMRTPMLHYPDNIMPCAIAHRRVRLPKGKEALNYESRFEDFLQGG